MQFRSQNKVKMRFYVTTFKVYKKEGAQAPPSPYVVYQVMEIIFIMRIYLHFPYLELGFVQLD